MGDPVDGALKEEKRYQRGHAVFEAQGCSFGQAEFEANRQRFALAVFSGGRGRRSEPQAGGVDLASYRQGREDLRSQRGWRPAPGEHSSWGW